LAPCADPVPFRQREQWQRKKPSNSPEMWNRTTPQRQEPDVIWVMGVLARFEPMAAVEWRQPCRLVPRFYRNPVMPARGMVMPSRSATRH
jgi:hypothetical protein